MLKRFLIFFFIGLLIPFSGSSKSASAQVQTLLMQPDDIWLLLLSEEDLTVRINAISGGEVFFAVHHLPDFSFDARLDTLDGETIALEPITTSSNSVSFATALPEAGEYQLVMTANSSRGGYIRLHYSPTQPDIERPDTSLTFLQDPLETIWVDPFATNETGWFTSGSVNIWGGSLNIIINDPAPVYSGLVSIPDLVGLNYYVTAEVTPLGDQNDSAFGLIVRLLDAGNLYQVQIAPELSAWRIVRLNDGQWENLHGWHEDERLQNITGTHEIGMWVMGDVLMPLWDGQPLGHIRDLGHLTGGIGFYGELGGGGEGQPRYIFDNLRVGIEPQGFAWGRPRLPDATTLNGQGLETTQTAGEASLSAALVGEWYWSDPEDSLSMTLLFEDSGDFTQIIQQLDGAAEPHPQNGRWSIEDEQILVLDINGLPQQRYTPRLESENLVLVLPELDNRSFVWVPSASDE